MIIINPNVPFSKVFKKNLDILFLFFCSDEQCCILSLSTRHPDIYLWLYVHKLVIVIGHLFIIRMF